MNLPLAEVPFLQELQDRSFALASEATKTSYPDEHRMSGAALADYLARRRYLVMATVRSSGRPHAALSAFVFSNHRFWLPTMAGTARERNVRAVRAVSLVVAEGDGADHRAVLIEGSAEVLLEAEASAAHYWTQRHDKPPDWADSWIKVAPTKLFSYDAALPAQELIGWTCELCGDTFTAHSGEVPRCPSCGNAAARVATEPFL